ncbi:MAG: galactokinase [Pseudomonadota bacterium]
MDTAELSRQFFDRYGHSAKALRSFYAPGRVNLIGDHTDYSGGLVFPCAINYGTTLLIREAEKSAIQLASANFDLFAVLSRDQAGQKYGDHWINYPLGVLQQFEKAGVDVGGIECLFWGNVPNGAGLSSSASVSVVTAYALNELFDCGLDDLTLVQMAQRAENDFVGVQCGIMDQYAVTMGKRNHAMMLDCETLACEQVPLELDQAAIVLINTNQRRELSESKYNERVAETQDALQRISAHTGATALAQLTPQQLSDCRMMFAGADTVYQRARHVISEHHRVKEAVVALTKQDLESFGRLMFQSHESLRDDYSVSSDPLNALVDIGRDTTGVLGARLTGAGFGGCTVNLVRSDAVHALQDNVARYYKEQTGLSADAYLITPSDGVKEVDV